MSLPDWNLKTYEQQRYERLLESIDEYVTDEDAPDLIHDLLKCLAEIKMDPLKQIKRITRLQQTLKQEQFFTES
jgi:hypothetical protein